MKHYYIRLCAVAFIILTAGFPAMRAQETILLNGILYKLNPDHTAIVTGYDKGYTDYLSTVLIDIDYNGTYYSITEIGNSAFENCDKFDIIYLGSSTTRIGDRAFYNCNSMNSVEYIGETEPEIGTDAFYCSGDTHRTLYLPSAPRGTFHPSKWGNNVEIRYQHLGSVDNNIASEESAIEYKNGNIYLKDMPGESYRIYNAAGRLICSGTISSSDETLEFKVQAGIYLVKTRSKTRKILVR